MEICHNHDASIAYCNDEYGDCPLCRANDTIAEFKDVIAELKKDVERLESEILCLRKLIYPRS